MHSAGYPPYSRKRAADSPAIAIVPTSSARRSALHRVRGRGGDALYAGGTLRRADGRKVVFGPNDVRFVPRRRWRSPATGALYPVEGEFVVKLPEGERRFRLIPLFDAQELDGRAAGMPAYWEGAVSTNGGRGYLELTGYAGDLKL